MTETEVNAVERQLKVRLPQHYRKFLVNYPVPLIDTKLNLGWTQEAPADRKLSNNAARLVQLNRDVRQPGTPWIEDDGPWPEQYFVIGDDQCGNYWSVNLQATESGVWFYTHDTGRFAREHEDLAAFGAALLAEIAEFTRNKNSG